MGRMEQAWAERRPAHAGGDRSKPSIRAPPRVRAALDISIFSDSFPESKLAAGQRASDRTPAPQRAGTSSPPGLSTSTAEISPGRLCRGSIWSARSGETDRSRDPTGRAPPAVPKARPAAAQPCCSPSPSFVAGLSCARSAEFLSARGGRRRAASAPLAVRTINSWSVFGAISGAGHREQAACPAFCSVTTVRNKKTIKFVVSYFL